MKHLTAALAALLAAGILTACAQKGAAAPTQTPAPAASQSTPAQTAPETQPAPAGQTAAGEVSREEALAIAYGIPIWDIEFETEYGDYDFEVAISGGRIVGADYEVDDEWLDRLSRHTGSPLTAEQAQDAVAAKAPDAQTFRLWQEESDGRLRYEGEAYGDDIKYEFELDAATGVIYDWNADLRE